MLYSNIFYKKYAKNIYSGNGEDGIINELLKRIDISNGFVCEFGAWDGINASNTFNLIENLDFSGIYIEGDNNRYKDLLNTCNIHKNITPINCFISHDQNDDNSLDNILAKTDIPYDFDILSIDIDSHDYHVWKSLKNYKPKIVIIEINSSIQPNNNYHIHEPNKYQGTGFGPTYNLGIEKGYKFVLHTGNMIFVRNDLFDKLNISYNDPLDNFRTNWLRR